MNEYPAPSRHRRLVVAGLSALLCSAALITATPTRAQSCHPAPLVRDTAVRAGTTLVRVAGDYERGEKGSRRVRLTAGQSYWFAASGCPRTGDVDMTVVGPDGNVVMQRIGHEVGSCLKADKTGDYTFIVSPKTLRGGYTWGSIAAEASPSDCIS